MVYDKGMTSYAAADADSSAGGTAYVRTAAY